MPSYRQHGVELVQRRILAFHIQGDVGGLTCYTNKRHKQVAFPIAPPRTPPTPNQTIQRAKFNSTQARWAALTRPARALWNTAARLANLSITGRNLFFACAIRNDWSYADTVGRQAQITLPHG
jgi:hypothetical protein